MKKRAFTLIELLVVISIIALLVSILMPALSKARNSAKSVVCVSNLRQWSVVTQMYVGDNDDRYWYDGPIRNPAPGQQIQAFWMEMLGKYYSGEGDLRFCPMAVKYSPIANAVNGATDEAWDATDHVANINPEFSQGSYGTNLWLSPAYDFNRPGWGFVSDVAKNRTYHWGKVSAKNSSEIPVVGDCTWFGVEPHDFSTGGALGAIPTEPDYYKTHKPNAGTGVFNNYYARICLDRHSKAVNWGFADGSAHKVQLPDLWTLRWHKRYKREGNIQIPWLN